MYRMAVVDDEAGQVEILTALLTSVMPGFAVFAFTRSQDVLNAMEQQAFDVVITDVRMPVVDGLELARHIHERHPKTVLCMISAYSDFAYAQRAIDLGVTSYLIKPVSMEKLVEMASRIEKQLNQRDSLLNLYAEYENARQTMDERKLYNWLSKTLDGSGHPFAEIEKSSGFLCLFRVNGAEMAQPLRRAFVALWKNAKVLFATPSRESNLLAGLVLTSQREKSEALARRISQLARAGTMFFHAALAPSTADWPGCFQQALSLLDASFFIPKPPCLVAAHIEGCVPFPQAAFYALEKELLYALREQKIEAIGKQLRSFGEMCATRRWLVPSHQGKEWMLHLTASIHRQLEWGDASELDKALAAVQTMDEALRLLQGYMESLAKQQRQRLADTTEGLIYRVINYVQDNCCNDLSLEQVASRFHLSPAYLSSMFKQYAGKGFKECLIQARIEQAKQLLVQTQHRVYEISHMVGYTDTTYFVKLFKREVGLSPNRYRGLERS